jgi:hypothetical protein
MQKALKHLILYKIQQQQLTKNKKQKQKQKTNKQTTRHSLSPPRHAAIYLQKLHLHTSPPHLLINPLKCSSDISDLISPGS